jgi:hypothetical protein
MVVWRRNESLIEGESWSRVRWWVVFLFDEVTARLYEISTVVRFLLDNYFSRFSWRRWNDPSMRVHLCRKNPSRCCPARVVWMRVVARFVDLGAFFTGEFHVLGDGDPDVTTDSSQTTRLATEFRPSVPHLPLLDGGKGGRGSDVARLLRRFSSTETAGASWLHDCSRQGRRGTVVRTLWLSLTPQ